MGPPGRPFQALHPGAHLARAKARCSHRRQVARRERRRACPHARRPAAGRCATGRGGAAHWARTKESSPRTRFRSQAAPAGGRSPPGLTQGRARSPASRAGRGCARPAPRWAAPGVASSCTGAWASAKRLRATVGKRRQLLVAEQAHAAFVRAAATSAEVRPPRRRCRFGAAGRPMQAGFAQQAAGGRRETGKVEPLQSRPRPGPLQLWRAPGGGCAPHSLPR